MPARPASFWAKADLPKPGAGSLYLLVPWMVSRTHNYWFSLDFFFFFPLLPADPYSHLGEYLFSNFLNRAHSSGSESQKNEMAVARRRKFGPWIPAMDGSLRYEATSLAKQVLDQHTHTHTHTTHTHTHTTHTHTHTHTHLPLPEKQERQIHPGNLLHIPVGF